VKILYVTTISNTINAFLVPHIKFLIDKGHAVEIACRISQEFTHELVELGLFHHEISFNRRPLSRDNLRAYNSIKRLIKRNHYDVIHVHTPIASFLTRLATKRLKTTKIIYTAHGFHFYKGASLLNWLLYYPIEKYLSKFTDVLITINQEDYARALKKFHSRKIVHIPGVGIKIKKFNITIDKDKKRNELAIPKEAFLILSVGELNKNKNHETVLRSLSEIKDNSIHYAICGVGPLEYKLNKLAERKGLKNRFHLLGHRTDVNEIYKISDLFVMPSKREGLPVAMIEALLSNIPSIGSDIRGIRDLALKTSTLSTFSNSNELVELIENHLFSKKVFLLDNKDLVTDLNQEVVLNRIYKEYT